MCPAGCRSGKEAGVAGWSEQDVRSEVMEDRHLLQSRSNQRVLSRGGLGSDLCLKESLLVFYSVKGAGMETGKAVRRPLKLQ